MGILVAVEPAPLLRIIEYLLDTRPEFRIVAKASNGKTLARQAERLQPELIIANMRLLGQNASRIIPAVKQASPRSMLIVTGFPQGLGRDARRCGADVYLEEEQLVQRLVFTARKALRRLPAASPSRTKLTGSILASPSKGQHPLLNSSGSWAGGAKPRKRKSVP